MDFSQTQMPDHVLILGYEMPVLPPCETCNYQDLTQFQHASFSQFAKLHTAEDLPPLVVSSLFDTRGDAFEVATTLNALAFKGEYCVMAPPLAQRKVVLRELQKAAPDVDISLITLPELADA
ncbi:hypothetical protein L1065_00975 [Nereida sp. MMG024]|nr:hypothetical protein [Nereida sp. MMG025]